MSQIKFEKPLRLELTFTFIHKLYLYLFHMAAVIVLLSPFGLHVVIKLIFFVFILFSFYLTKRNIAMNYAGCLLYLETSNWLWSKEDEDRQLRLVDGIVLLPQVIILRFETRNGKKYSWTLFPDRINKDTFRRLRVLLRYSTTETHSSLV